MHIGRRYYKWNMKKMFERTFGINFQKIVVLLSIFVLSLTCKNSDSKMDFASMSAIFADRGQGGVALFTLLDNYPGMKNALSKLSPTDFNRILNQSLTPVRNTVGPGLNSLGDLFVNSSDPMRSTFRSLSSLINRIRTGNPNSYNQVLNLFEKVRSGPSFFVPNIIPLSNTGLNSLSLNYTQDRMRTAVMNLSNNLRSQSTIDFMRKVENFLIKTTIDNPSAKTAVVQLLSGLADSSQLNDKSMKDSLLKTLGGLGDAFLAQAGLLSGKSSGMVLKELVVNLSNTFTTTGSVFTSNASYNTANFSTELSVLFNDLYLAVRRIVTPPSNVVVNRDLGILNPLMTNYNALRYTTSLTDVDSSVLGMIASDVVGMNRATNVNSDPISAMEGLFFVLSVADNFGYNWNASGSSVMITSMTNGVITIGDALHSLSSKVQVSNPCNDALANLGVYCILLNGSFYANSRSYVTRNSVIYPIDPNTPALNLLEGESRGAIPEITTYGQTPDSIYIKTVPWVLNLISRTTFQGKGPYFNRNRKDASGNILNPDGTIYRNAAGTDISYRSSWLTASYGTFSARQRTVSFTNGSNQIVMSNGTFANSAIQLGMAIEPYPGAAASDFPFPFPNYPTPSGITVTNITNDAFNTFITMSSAANVTGTRTVSIGWYIGLGGITSGTPNSGSSYTINEIAFPDSARGVTSDEEALHRNFQWLLYEKRFVLVIPIHVVALNAQVVEATYALIVANGLKGLMNVKPYCTPTECRYQDNGIWLLSNLKLKNDYRTPGDLNNFSSIPGDSVFLRETWGFGIAGTSYGFTDATIEDQVNKLLFANYLSPNDFYGPIPAAIKWNFPYLERLGMLTDRAVNQDSDPSNDQYIGSGDVSSFWSSRNRLLPLIAALGKTLTDQSDSASNKNAFTLLTNLANILARPYILQRIDPVQQNGSSSIPIQSNNSVSIIDFRVRGFSGAFGIRSPRMPTASLYYSDSVLRSPISFLVENQRRFQDGILSLVGRSSLLTNLGQFLANAGKSTLAASRTKLTSGLVNFIGQIRVNSDSPPPSSIQFNLTNSINELTNDIRTYPIGKPTDLNASDWKNLDDIANALGDILGNSSPYSYVPNLTKVMDALIEARPLDSELSALLDVLGAILTQPNTTNTPSYRLTTLLTSDVPTLLPAIADSANSFTGLLDGLTRQNQFLIWFWTFSKSDSNLNTLISEAERFLVDPMIQTSARDRNDFLFNTGQILKLFSGVASSPTRQTYGPYWFPDQYNTNQDVSTVFDRFNYLLSNK